MNFWLGASRLQPPFPYGFGTGAVVPIIRHRALLLRASLTPASRRPLAHANDKASGVIFQNGAATYSVDGTARYYLASWGRTHLTPSRGRASAQKGCPQRQRISYLSPRERTRHGIPAVRGAGHGAPDAGP